MIVITGGAGFIGSVLVWQLNRRNRDDIIIVDHLGNSDKWKNLRGLRYADYYDKHDFIQKLEGGFFGNSIDVLVHLGACTSTVERNADYLIDNNFRYSARLGHWWIGRKNVRFIYASSAATYGDGSRGYTDDVERLVLLRPLNMYGYSKHMFDLYAWRRGWLSSCAGLKYFNVFGPNENHKGEMRSVIAKAYPMVRDEGRMVLFKSHRPQFADGEQRRDFLYVKDAVTMTLFFIDHPEANGIYNIGTGTARSWNDVGRAIFSAVGKPLRIEYVPMPESIRDSYQYVTQADISRIRNAGCNHCCMSLEQAVAEYVQSYLSIDARIGD